MKTWLIAGLVLLLATTGGVQFYDSKCVQLIWFGLFVILTGVVICTPEWPPLMTPVMTICGAVFISGVFNMDIGEAVLVRLFMVSIASWLMIWAGREATADIQEGITLAAFIWPLILMASAWFNLDNRNIWGFWSALFLVVASRYGAQPHPHPIAIPLVVALLLTQSRGAIIAGLSGFIIPHVWGHRRQMTAFSLAGVVLVVWMYYWSPGTALNRLSYWADALDGWLTSPWVGLGPGGLKARQIISHPGGGYQVHAHNFILTWLAECGILGMALVGWAIEQAYELRDRLIIEPWHVAAVVAVLVHSLVDEPLFWPGPLAVMGIILGSVKLREA